MDFTQSRPPQTRQPIKLIGDNVLLKISYNVSAMAFSQGKIPKDYNDKTVLTVEGYGPTTHGFQIGDVVKLTNDYTNSAPFGVNLPNNTKSFKYYSSLFEKLTPDQRKIIISRIKRYKLEEYVIIPAYGILGYYDSTSEAAKQLLDLDSEIKLTTKEANKVFDV